MLFTRKDISNEKLGAILKNWFESYNLLKPVYDLYFKVFYGLIQGLEWQFLALVQAIEAYHQRKVDPSCSSNFTLRDRLRSVYSDYGDILTSLEIEREGLSRYLCKFPGISFIGILLIGLQNIQLTLPVSSANPLSFPSISR